MLDGPHYVTAGPARQPDSSLGERFLARSLRVLVLDPRAPAIVDALGPHVPADVAFDVAKGVAAVAEGEDARVCLGRPDLVALAGDRLPRLEWVQSTWAGVRPLLPLLAARPEIVATTPKGIFGDAMAEYVLGWLVALDRRLLDYVSQQREGYWKPLPDRGLTGRRVLLLGTGSIGGRVAERLAAFGMEVVGVSRSGRQTPGVARTWPTKDRLVAARRAEVLVNTLPETDATRGVIDAALLGALERGAVVVNVGRGSAVVDAALLDALATGQLSAAVLDVFEQEPLPAEHPFWTTPNIHVTPHVSAPTRDADIARVFAANLERWRTGRVLEGAVDSEAGY